MPTSADLLLDTSAAIALMTPASEFHRRVLDRTTGATLGLAGHAAFETYSVLTRLPGQLRLSGDAARRIMAANFPATAHLPADHARRALDALADAGVTGGAVYDGLVGLAAVAAGIRLLSCDRRALGTYAALGVDVDLI